VANLGVLVGSSGVIVVNTGSSAEHGAALLAAVARLTDRPVVWRSTRKPARTGAG